MMFLFTCALHNSNEVEPRAAPAQHHNDINKINKQDRQNKLNEQADINEIKDFLKTL